MRYLLVPALIICFELTGAAMCPVFEEDPSKETSEAVIAQQKFLDSHLANIENALPRAIFWHQGFLNILNRYPELTLAQLEELLRARNSHLHLFAVPVNTSTDPQARARVPSSQQDLPYYLHVESSKNADIEKVLSRLGISAAENLERLRQSGFLETGKPPAVGHGGG